MNVQLSAESRAGQLQKQGRYLRTELWLRDFSEDAEGALNVPLRRLTPAPGRNDRAAVSWCSDTLTPGFHIWVRSKQPWIFIPTDVPVFAMQPEPEERRELPTRKNRADA